MRSSKTSALRIKTVILHLIIGSLLCLSSSLQTGISQLFPRLCATAGTLLSSPFDIDILT